MAEIGGQSSGWVGSWTPDDLVKDTEKNLARGLVRAAAHLVGAIKEDISLPGPTKTHRTGSVVVKGGTATDVRPSAPGEPPRRRTGALRSSIMFEQIDSKGLLWRVGSPLIYALPLEFGYEPRNLDERPFLRPAMIREGARMNSLVRRELKRGS